MPNDELIDVTPFEPVPEADKPLYRFKLERYFYADEAARQADIDRVTHAGERLREIAAAPIDPSLLLEALVLLEATSILADRLVAYGGLKFAVDTRDSALSEESETLSSVFAAAGTFLQPTVQAMSDASLAAAVQARPELRKYEAVIRRWRRAAANVAAPAVETALAALGDDLDPFSARFYNLLVGRAPDRLLTVNGKSIDVTKDDEYAVAQRLPDRSLREKAYRMRLAAFTAQQDVYSHALRRKAIAANDVARLRHFTDAPQATAFKNYLSEDLVNAVLDKFKERADLSRRFEAAEAAFQAKRLGLVDIRPWDLFADPPGSEAPRLQIGEASARTIEATAKFGPDYARELEHLLDPANGRMDVVSGPNRQPGDFTWGSYGKRSWVFFMQGYSGYLPDVVALAHEAAHAVHFSFMGERDVGYFNADGARYVTEGLAKVNEILILERLADAAVGPVKAIYARELASKLCSVHFTSMFWAAYATSFEIETYKRIGDGRIRKDSDIHAVWEEYGRLWSSGFDDFPDKRFMWAATHHFFDSPLYYANYLFAWVLAVAVRERLASEAGFAVKFVELMKAGFPTEPLALLKTSLGIELDDVAALDRIFDLVEMRLCAFEAAVAAS